MATPTFNSLRQTLETVMLSWSTTPVAYENVKFDVPSSPWVRFLVLTGAGESFGIDGVKKYVRDRGEIVCEIYVFEFTGTKDAKTIADGLISMFEVKSLSDGIHTAPATVKTIGATQPGWYQTDVVIPYWRDRYVTS